MVNPKENTSVISLRNKKKIEETHKEPINSKETKDELIQEEASKYNNVEDNQHDVQLEFGNWSMCNATCCYAIAPYVPPMRHSICFLELCRTMCR